VKAAVLGAGYQGRLHVEKLSGLDDVEVVAVCDTNETRAAEVAATFEVGNVYGDYRQLLDVHDLDLVTVCTMPVLHLEMTVAALDAGAHVLCEKPLAMDAVEGRAMLDAARSAGRLLTVGFNVRHTRSAQVLKRFVDSGRFGDAVYTRAWARSSQIPWWGQHYRRDVSGGGALASTAVHLVDLALWLAGNPTPSTASASMRRLFPTKRGATRPDDVAAHVYDAEDLISGHVRFDNGFWLSVEGSWIDNRPSVEGVPSWDYSLDAVGELAQMQFDPLSITVEDEYGGIISAVDPGEDPGVDLPDSTGALIEDVVDAIRNSRPPVVRAEEALVVQAIVDSLYRSAANGSEVDVVVPR
jgi:predicted dehydrogenase